MYHEPDPSPIRQESIEIEDPGGGLIWPEERTTPGYNDRF